MLDLLTWYLTHFSDIIAYRGNCKNPPHQPTFFFFLKPLQVDIVTSKIQLSGMLLNFWRGWRAGWKRYCSRVFHQHSDQYHQILNMGRNHSLWRAVENEWTKAGKTQDLLPRMLTEKNIYQKWLGGVRLFNQIHTNTIPFHSMQRGCIAL